MKGRFSHRTLTLFTPLLGALAFAAFPAAASAAPPVNNTPPQITIPAGGASNEITNPSEGRTLTSTNGTWTPAQQFYQRQWMHDCPAGLPGTPIPGATNATYTIANSDIGHTLCLSVTAGGTQALSQTTGTVTAGTPLDRAAPTISGILQDGQTLTATSGTWAGTAPITFQWQWKRCNSAGGLCGLPFDAMSATPTYTLTDTDVGRTMQVLVTATGSGTSVQAGAKQATGLVLPANTGAPSISGTDQVGKTLNESHGSWLPANPASYSYQWEQCDASGANCSAIPGANSQSYKLAPSDAGHRVLVQESSTYNGATSNPASSSPSGTVKSAPSNNGGGKNGGGNGGNGGNGGQTGGNGGQTGGNGGQTGGKNLSTAAIRRLLMGVLVARGKGANIQTLLRHGGYTFSFSAPSAGHLQILWFRRVHGKRQLVAIVNVTFHKAGKSKVQIRLTGIGRNLLKHSRRLKLTASGGFTPSGHQVTNASRTITLRG